MYGGGWGFINKKDNTKKEQTHIKNIIKLTQPKKKHKNRIRSKRDKTTEQRKNSEHKTNL